MAHLNLYRPDENWYMRVVRQSDGYVYNANSGAFEVNTSWVNSVVTLTYSEVIGGYSVTVPTACVNGKFDLLFYNAASPLSSDESQYGEEYVDL
jgi:hypothetical protein